MKLLNEQIAKTCWEMQSEGKTFAEIALATWPMFFAAFTPRSKQKLEQQIDKAPEGPERDKVILQWLKGTLDNMILQAGKLGLQQMYLEGRLTQARALELARAKKADQNLFNAVLARFNREDGYVPAVPEPVHDLKVTITKGCRIGTITFGGQQFWNVKAKQAFEYNRMVEQNDHFIVVQSGLNLYVFPAKCVRV